MPDAKYSRESRNSIPTPISDNSALTPKGLQAYDGTGIAGGERGVGDMVLFLSWSRPSPDQQKACIARSGGAFNYDSKFHGASANPALYSSSSQEPRQREEEEEALFKDGFFVNRTRVLLGSGPRTFQCAKTALQSWRHFGLGWTFVDSKTPVEKGANFCVCVKEILPWIMMPLQVSYVTDTSNSKPIAGGGAVLSSNFIKACFGFGSGTLHGHLLAGEERFSIEWDENDQVWYDIFSFSKPAHFLSIVGSPYVQLRQKYFAQQSTKALLKHVIEQPSSM